MSNHRADKSWADLMDEHPEEDWPLELMLHYTGLQDGSSNVPPAHGPLPLRPKSIPGENHQHIPQIGQIYVSQGGTASTQDDESVNGAYDSNVDDDRQIVPDSSQDNIVYTSEPNVDDGVQIMTDFTESEDVYTLDDGTRIVPDSTQSEAVYTPDFNVDDGMRIMTDFTENEAASTSKTNLDDGSRIVPDSTQYEVAQNAISSGHFLELTSSGGGASPTPFHAKDQALYEDISSGSDIPSDVLMELDLEAESERQAAADMITDPSFLSSIPWSTKCRPFMPLEERCALFRRWCEENSVGDHSDSDALHAATIQLGRQYEAELQATSNGLAAQDGVEESGRSEWEQIILDHAGPEARAFVERVLQLVPRDQ